MLTFNPYITNINFKSKGSFDGVCASSDIAGRKLVNLVNDVFEKRETKEKKEELLNKDIPKIDRYIKAGRLYGSDIDIEINLDNDILDKIVESDKSTIFIMNHDNQKMDPKLLLIFNTILMKKYKEKGKDYKEPKIILNENILKGMSPKNRQIFEEMGAIGIDADCMHKKDTNNARALVPVMKDFVEDKGNVYIFPEGILSACTSSPLENKFQNGVANVVLKKLNAKKDVQIVPLGFAYSDNKNLAGIYIGNPIIFKTNEDGVTGCTEGNILSSEYGNQDYKKYFHRHEQEEFIPILRKGKKVEKKSLVPFISQILCENLKICKAESYESIKDTDSKQDFVELV